MSGASTEEGVSRLEADNRRMRDALRRIETFAAGTHPGTKEIDHIADMAHQALEPTK